MTIIRKDVNKIGTAWSRKVNANLVESNGEGVVLYSMIIPPYVWPGYMWAKWRMIDWSADGVRPWLSAEANVFIQMVEIPDTVARSSYDTKAEVLTLANTYAPLDEVFVGTDSGTDDEVGFTGLTDSTIPDQFSRTLCKRYHYEMGIGKNAYPTNANYIRYLVEGKYNGHLKTKEMVDIAKPKLVLIRANTQAPYADPDEDHGMSGGLEMEALYSTLVDNIPGRNDDTTGITGEDLDSTLQNYLNEGTTGDQSMGSYFDAQDLATTVNVTMRLDIYEPAPRGHINPRNNP